MSIRHCGIPLTTGFFLSILGIGFLSPPSSDGAVPLIKVKPIKGTSLFTGIFYRIDLKNTGLLSWSNKETSAGANHVQIIYGDEVKSFGPGGIYWADSQWMFMPSEDKDGWYVMYNKNKPHAVVALAGKSVSGKWVGMYQNKDNDTDYQAGGKYRDKVLWSIKPEPDAGPDPEYYNFFNAFFPKSGIMTWSTKDVSSGKKFVQVYDDEDPNLYTKNKDYLWKLTPSSSYTFTAIMNIMSSDKQPTPANIRFSDESKRKYYVRHAAFKNDKDSYTSDVLQRRFLRQNSYKFSFEDSFQFLSNFEITAQTLSILCNRLDFEATYEELQSGPPTVIKHDMLDLFDLNLKFVLPPKSCKEFEAYYYDYSNTLKFIGQVNVYAKTERMARDKEIRQNKGITGEAIKVILPQFTNFKKTASDMGDSYAKYKVNGNLTVNVGFYKRWSSKVLDCSKFDDTKEETADGTFNPPSKIVPS